MVFKFQKMYPSYKPCIYPGNVMWLVVYFYQRTGALVKIISFCIKTSFFLIFPSLTEIKKEKRKESSIKTCNKRGVYQCLGVNIFPKSLPAFGCQPEFKSNTLTLVDPLLRAFVETSTQNHQIKFPFKTCFLIFYDGN